MCACAFGDGARGQPPLNPGEAASPRMDFRQVYDEHVVFVWRSLRRLGVAESALKDAVQDVFLVVHRRLPDFAPNPKVSTWLFRIPMGIARDHRTRAHAPPQRPHPSA